MTEDEEIKRFHIPTRDSFTFSKEDDGGYTLNISIKRDTFDALAKNHRDTLQQIAVLLLSMQGEFDTRPASSLD